MIRASKVREIALQILFAWDSQNEADEKSAMRISLDASDDATTRLRAIESAQQTWAYRMDADTWVERIAPQWPPRRQPVVDRNIIRLAMWELTTKATPPSVVIDEAIELAKLYSTENSPSFVNGVLDTILKEITSLKQL
ncbi:MAG: transcription antitermination factor NusB [Burkholderiales bacterium]|nr:transcription antitermination factor NusB [Phycisphaerae bacterium]